MVEEQVEVVILVVDRDPLLPGHEREAGPELQDERLEVPEDGRLQVPLAVGILEPEEVQEIRVAKDQVGRDAVLVPEGGKLLSGQPFGPP
jgi:hypothetical protein